MRKPKQGQNCRVRKDKLVLLTKEKYFESAALINFGKIYLIFMPICFKSFDVSHHFLKTAAPVQNHVVATMYKHV